VTPLVLAAVLWRAPAAVVVPNDATRSVALPPVAAPARLAFQARADYPRFAGSNLFLRVVVNGEAVGLMRDRRTSRLVETPATLDGALRRFAFGRWRVSYGPMFRPRDAVALDVTDLLRADGPNVVAFEHGPATSAGPTPLVVDGIRLESVPGRAAVAAPRPPDDTSPRVGFPTPPAFTVRHGAHRIDVAWDRAAVAVTTTVRGGTHEWTRDVVTTPTHVEVRDTIRNPGRDPIGLRIRHAVAADSPGVRLGGRTDPDVNDAYDPWNPTVFVPLGAGGVGLVAEDDVLRQQLHVDFDPSDGTAGLRTESFCLGAGEIATLAWSVYPTRAARYWDFVNTVRRDWGVDATVPGAYVWFRPDDVLAMDDAALAAALARERIAIASMWGGWLDPKRTERPAVIGFGSAVLGEPFASLRERIRAAVAKLHAARPGTTVLLYFDAQRDSRPDAPRRFADSVLRPVERVDWGRRYTPSWSMVPTGENSFGRALGDVAAAMRALGADGLYWDEMDAVDYETSRTTTAPSDGRTCELDADGRVVRRLGLANLLSDAVKRRLAAGGALLGNSPPTTRALQRRLAMIEGQHNEAWATFAHLSTPLAYIGARRDFGAVVAQVDAGLLAAGTQLDYAYDPPRLFPLTPEYVQAGTVRGRERIVTTRSGTHGWTAGGGDVRAFHYDRDGRETAASWRTKRRRDGVFVRVRLAPGELAVIERDHAEPPAAR
jgi:hypothetical protein